MRTHRISNPKPARPTLLAWAALAGLVLTMTACGTTSDPVAIRIADTAITQHSVKHWTSLLTARGTNPVTARQASTPREQAVGYLITAAWLTDEAAQDGLALAPSDIGRQRAQKERMLFPDGRPEREEYLHTTGETTSDLTFEAKTELAAQELRRMLAGKEPSITSTQVLDYYHHHTARFTNPERRYVEITNRKTIPDTIALKQVAEASNSFAAHSSNEWLTLTPASYDHSRGSDATLARAVHLAQPNTLTGPVKHYVDYYLFKVIRVEPATLQPLNDVRKTIEAQLATEQRQHTLVTFTNELRKRWITRTHCQATYTTPKCHPEQQQASSSDL